MFDANKPNLELCQTCYTRHVSKIWRSRFPMPLQTIGYTDAHTLGTQGTQVGKQMRGKSELGYEYGAWKCVQGSESRRRAAEKQLKSNRTIARLRRSARSTAGGRLTEERRSWWRASPSPFPSHEW
ncbi:hypothetical protein B0T17DRAFT_324391 [Bombardia bombarda]|uniref:Uncharacterized protein n=1 Tax=Bombardia bombarda TaxID=252184 RepID=A0AA39WMK3_9PEZI|nr:hypothetical protein B0T17DRAFT_324391 [Bombardia bombarda]